MKKWFFLGISIICLIVVYFIFSPNNIYFPKCPFLLLTGYKCPGCGSQRAIHSLLHLDVIQAFKCNAYLVISIPIIVLLLYAEFYRKKRPHLYLILQNRYFIWSFFLITIMWWITRNILGL
jgi:hypothetical protein